MHDARYIARKSKDLHLSFSVELVARNLWCSHEQVAPTSKCAAASLEQKNKLRILPLLLHVRNILCFV